MDLSDFIISFYSRPLSASELQQRWVRQIEDFRVLHEIGCSRRTAASPDGRISRPNAANSVCPPQVPPKESPSLLGAQGKCAVWWEEDFRCPFCPPYNLPVTASMVEIQQLLTPTV